MQGLVWKVLTVKDNGRTYYRYSITGEVWDAGKLLHAFSWSVPSIDAPPYDTSAAVWR